ncbi:MAG: DUF1028 domain-containing protein [Thermomicrobiales bacterium]
MTFSIAARCADTGMFGIAISSSSPAVAARCAWVRAGTGAACTQNITDPRLGTALLDLLERGASATEAMGSITATEPLIGWRQLTVIDRDGATAAYSGEGVLGTHDVSMGQNCIAAGNLLASPAVPAAMTAAFEASAGQGRHLGARLVAAMRAAVAAGGEEGPVHSAGLLIAREVAWPVADLRVDWSDDPIGDLAALWTLWEPQLDAYVTRALNPGGAPSYGVPGDR